MSGYNLPPGCSVSDLPGCSKADEAFDKAYEDALYDLQRNPSEFVDMMVDECVLDYYDAPKRDELSQFVAKNNPERHPSSRKLCDALHSIYKAYLAGTAQTYEEATIGKSLAYFADKFATEQAENAGE